MARVTANLAEVRRRIARAARRRGVCPDKIKLVAVTKNIAPSQIKEAVGAGITDVGENRVQEMLPKLEEVNGKVRWHFVGHLQRNKAKYIVGRVELIQSLDSLQLAQEINRQGSKKGVVQKVLVEVNVSGEESKFGLSPQELPNFLTQLADLKFLSVRGLMTMAPLVDKPGKTRAVFVVLKRLFDQVKEMDIPHAKMELLSMGMTQDFEVAIEEGANMIRLGTAIFRGL